MNFLKDQALPQDFEAFRFATLGDRDHGLNATSFIHVSSVHFLSVCYYRFQMMNSCPVTKNLTPQEQVYFLHGAK